MNNRNLARGLFLVAFSLLFGIWSRQYTVGDFSRAGSGLFPLMVSCLLLVLGIITLVRSYFVEAARIEFNYRNIAIVLASLCGFALLTEFVNMIAGIVFLVFCSTAAGTSYSVVRNLKISAGLLGIALAMKFFLGVDLPLY